MTSSVHVFKALLITLFLGAAAHAQTELPATDLNVARYWHALADQSPDYEGLARSTRSYLSANQFDQQDVFERNLTAIQEAFTADFTASEFLVVNLALDLATYDFERSGFEIGVFDGNTFIPTRSPWIDIGRDRVKLDGFDYRLVFNNPEPFAFLDLPPDAARTLLAGRNSKRVNLTVTLQPVGAQVDERDLGYATQTTRTVLAQVVNAAVRDQDQLVWEKSVQPVDAAELAAAAEKAGQVVEVTDQTVATVWHRLNGSTPNFTVEAAQTQAFQSANTFDRDRVLAEETDKAARRFAEFIPNAQRFGGRIRTAISEYDANRGGFNIALFSGGSFIDGGLYFINGPDFAFVPMSPAEADAFLDKHGRYPSALVEFEAQPILAKSTLASFANITPARQVQSHLTKVVITAESQGQSTVLIDETRPELGDDDIAALKALPASIDTALAFDNADIVLTWAKGTAREPDFDEWARQSNDYKFANNEFVRERLFPELVTARQDVFDAYELGPWRVRIAARLSDYDFDNQRFELRNVAFDQTLDYRDGLSTDIFGVSRARNRPYELRLTNIADLQYFNIPTPDAEELLTQMGAGRSVTLDMLVYPSGVIYQAPWDEAETRMVEAVITDVRLLGQSSRYGGGEVSRLYETTIAAPPSQVSVDVAIDAKPHVDPMEADIKTLQLGMAKGEFEREARRIFGRIEPYRGQEDVLRFENADGESGYGHFDETGTLVFLQYYRTLPGRGLTDAVVDSVIEKYGQPFARDASNIGSHITYAYLYFSDPAELGLDPREPKVGLWVEVQENSQLRDITQLEINLGTKPE